MSTMPDLPESVKLHIVALEEYFESENRNEDFDFISEGLLYQFSTGGKRLRPALCLLSCQIHGGDPSTTLPFAMATELLHNYLLIHDDIEDGDLIRRDMKTLWAEIGLPNALNVSDFMIARAYRLITESELPEGVRLRLCQAFSFVLQKTVEGQALDINLRGDGEVTLETYYRIVTCKTAFYLALPWVGGAMVAGASDDDVKPLWELGRCLGPAFQIRDDLIDLTEGKGRGGEIGCDIREGKPSICYAYALEAQKGTPEERQKLIRIVGAGRDDTTEEDISWVIDFYRREGILEFAQAEADRLAQESLLALDKLQVSEDGKKDFREVIRFVVDRKI
jgi:geranylgeranyl pyrophosphate synthase